MDIWEDITPGRKEGDTPRVMRIKDGGLRLCVSSEYRDTLGQWFMSCDIFNISRKKLEHADNLEEAKKESLCFLAGMIRSCECSFKRIQEAE